jgi:chaperonin GroES
LLAKLGGRCWLDESHLRCKALWYAKLQYRFSLARRLLSSLAYRKVRAVLADRVAMPLATGRSKTPSTSDFPRQFWRLLSMAKKKEETQEKAPSGKVNLQPLGDRVVVEREQSEAVTAGGIVLPDTAKDKPTRGKVVSVGNGRLLDDGTRGKMQVKAGDRVLFTSYAGEQFKLGERELLLMREEDILAVIE